MTKPADHTLRICIAIVALALVEVVALLTGHNGTLLRIVIVAISGLGGFSMAKLLGTTRRVNHLDAGDFLNRRP